MASLLRASFPLGLLCLVVGFAACSSPSSGVAADPGLVVELPEVTDPSGEAETVVEATPSEGVTDSVDTQGDVAPSCGSLPLPAGCACQQDKDCESGA